MSKKVEFNKSVFFILPMLNIDIANIKDFYNCYTSIYLNKIKEYRIIIVTNETDINNKYLSSFPGLIFRRSSIKNNYSEYYFSIPLEYFDDFLLFRKGKYSKMSIKYRQMLIKFYGVSRIAEINDRLKPGEEIKSKIAKRFETNPVFIQETLSKPDLIKENFTIDKLIKLKI